MAIDEEAVEKVLDYWLNTVGPEKWYVQDPELDADITDRFTELALQARAGRLCDWQLTPRGALAFITLLDQMHRNIWRGRAEAFAGDRRAVAAAKRSITQGQDLQIAEPARQIFYMPLMHAECLMDQDRCVRLMLTRLTDTGSGTNLPHAVAHRNIIREFGRFPFRNDALSRTHTTAERAWLEAGGYAA